MLVQVGLGLGLIYISNTYGRLHVLLDEIIDQRLKRRASGLPRCEDFLDVLLDQSNE